MSAQGDGFIWQRYASQAERTHPKTAVDGRDEHHRRQDNETGDEEADHQTRAAHNKDRGRDHLFTYSLHVCK